MKILVLGGSGFIGTHLCDAVAARGYSGVSFDLATPKKKVVGIEYIAKNVLSLGPNDIEGFDKVFHLAGLLGTSESFGFPEDIARTNILGTLRILECVRETGIPLSYITLGNEWLNPYTISKNAASNFCRMYNQYYGISIQVVVTYNLYGPFQKLRPIRKIIPTFMFQLINGIPVEVFGDGNQIVDLVYVEDFVRELLATEENGTIHIGTATSLQVNEVVKLCAKALGIDDFQIKHLDERRGEPPKSVSLSPLSYKHIEPTPILEALVETGKWYREVITRENDR